MNESSRAEAHVTYRDTITEERLAYAAVVDPQPNILVGGVADGAIKYSMIPFCRHFLFPSFANYNKKLKKIIIIIFILL